MGRRENSRLNGDEEGVPRCKERLDSGSPLLDACTSYCKREPSYAMNLCCRSSAAVL